MAHSSNGNSLLQEDVIRAAVTGDVEAIQSVLKHFERYTCKLVTRPLQDGTGTVHNVVDQEMKGRLETQLIKYILRFKLY